MSWLIKKRILVLSLLGGMIGSSFVFFLEGGIIEAAIIGALLGIVLELFYKTLIKKK
ncbi:hypothetical protein [uncultured Psychroserpens sp.]|uniref:hypothetical protein n=1 Tax=uncultured Psychroserpens sp. TaxID=255436 RepID=UPI00260EC89C|nr:hypothetical protein [uncultured Psychroserpens sp.]